MRLQVNLNPRKYAEWTQILEGATPILPNRYWITKLKYLGAIMQLKSPNEILKSQIRDRYGKSPFTKQQEKFIIECMLDYAAEAVAYIEPQIKELEDANEDNG